MLQMIAKSGAALPHLRVVARTLVDVAAARVPPKLMHYFNSSFSAKHSLVEISQSLEEFICNEIRDNCTDSMALYKTLIEKSSAVLLHEAFVKGDDLHERAKMAKIFSAAIAGISGYSPVKMKVTDLLDSRHVGRFAPFHSDGLSAKEPIDLLTLHCISEGFGDTSTVVADPLDLIDEIEENLGKIEAQKVLRKLEEPCYVHSNIGDNTAVPILKRGQRTWISFDSNDYNISDGINYDLAFVNDFDGEAARAAECLRIACVKLMEKRKYIAIEPKVGNIIAIRNTEVLHAKVPNSDLFDSMLEGDDRIMVRGHYVENARASRLMPQNEVRKFELL